MMFSLIENMHPTDLEITEVALSFIAVALMIAYLIKNAWDHHKREIARKKSRQKFFYKDRGELVGILFNKGWSMESAEVIADAIIRADARDVWDKIIEGGRDYEQ